MNLESILILHEINRTKSKRKAAEALGSSVDTISKYIENFESEMGGVLVDCNGRGCRITAQGHRVLEIGSCILDCLDEVYKIKPEKAKPSGEVRIGMTNGVSMNLMSHDIDEFYDNYPDIRLISMSIPDIPNLKLHSFDIGITYRIPEGDDFEIIHTKEVKCGFFAAPKFLQKYGYPADETDMLENYRLINKIDHVNYIKWWKDFCKKAKHIVYSANTTNSLLRVIANGGGIGIMPLRYKDEGLVCLDNIKCEADISFYLIALKNTSSHPRIRVCLDYYKQLLERM